MTTAKTTALPAPKMISRREAAEQLAAEAAAKAAKPKRAKKVKAPAAAPLLPGVEQHTPESQEALRKDTMTPETQESGGTVPPAPVKVPRARRAKKGAEEKALDAELKVKVETGPLVPETEQRDALQVGTETHEAIAAGKDPAAAFDAAVGTAPLAAVTEADAAQVLAVAAAVADAAKPDVHYGFLGTGYRFFLCGRPRLEDPTRMTTHLADVTCIGCTREAERLNKVNKLPPPPAEGQGEGVQAPAGAKPTSAPKEPSSSPEQAAVEGAFVLLGSAVLALLRDLKVAERTVKAVEKSFDPALVATSRSRDPNGKLVADTNLQWLAGKYAGTAHAAWAEQVRVASCHVRRGVGAAEALAAVKAASEAMAAVSAAK